MRATTFNRIRATLAALVLAAAASLAPANAFGHGVAPVLTDFTFVATSGEFGTFTASWTRTDGKPTKYNFLFHSAGGGTSGSVGKISAAQNRAGQMPFYATCQSGGYAEVTVSNAYGASTMTHYC